MAKNNFSEGHKPSLASAELLDWVHFTKTFCVELIPIMETILAENTADCEHVQNKPLLKERNLNFALKDNLRINQCPSREYILIAMSKPIPIKDRGKRSEIAVHQKSLSS